MNTLDFGDLPKRTSECTADQIERVVLFLAEKPLSELRRRQEVIEAQIRLAHRRAGNEPSNRGRMLEALEDLQDMHDHVSSAVWRKEFGDDSQHQRWPRRDEYAIEIRCPASISRRRNHAQDSSRHHKRPVPGVHVIRLNQLAAAYSGHTARHLHLPGEKQ